MLYYNRRLSASALSTLSLILLHVSGITVALKLQENLLPDKNAINRMEIRVAAYNYPPLFFIRKNGTNGFAYEGIFYEVGEMMANYYNFTLKYVHLDPEEEKKYGLIGALLRQLDRKEVDVSPYPFALDEDIRKHMELTYPLDIDSVTFLQPWPAEESRLDVTLRPFQLSVWLGFLLSVIAFIALTSTFLILQAMIDGDDVEPWDAIVYGQYEYSLTVLLSQGNIIPYSSRLSFRILVAAWLLPIVVLVYSYTGVLTALLSTPRLEPLISSYQELAASRFHITVEESTTITKMILDASSGPYKTLGDQLRHDSSLYIRNYVQIMENVRSGRCVYPAVEYIASYLTKVDVKTSGQCHMTASKRSDFFDMFQIGTVKSYAEFFRQIVFYSWENGLRSFIRKKYLPITANECRVDDQPQGDTKPLTLLDVTPAFFILGVGLTSSVFVFVAELAVASKFQHVR